MKLLSFFAVLSFALQAGAAHEPITECEKVIDQSLTKQGYKTSDFRKFAVGDHLSEVELYVVNTKTVKDPYPTPTIVVVQPYATSCQNVVSFREQPVKMIRTEKTCEKDALDYIKSSKADGLPVSDVTAITGFYYLTLDGASLAGLKLWMIDADYGVHLSNRYLVVTRQDGNECTIEASFVGDAEGY